MSGGLEIKKVLVVDNSPVMTKIIKNNLVDIGFAEDKIFMSNNGNQASMMLDLESFDLVTSGLHMSMKSEIKLLQEIRQNPDETKKDLPFLFISSERDPSYLDKADELGANGYIHKPFTPAQIKSAVGKLCGGAVNQDMDTEQPDVSGTATAEETGVDIDPKIINAFIDSTTEALGQYMVSAVPESPVADNDCKGCFSSLIDLSDETHSVKLALVLSFPKEVACNIYESIFGEVDLEMVCGVVEELVNIIAGAVKPKIAEFASDIISIVHPKSNPDSGSNAKLDLNLGLPVAQMGDDHPIKIEDPEAPRFIIPFKVQDEKFILAVHFLKA